MHGPVSPIDATDPALATPVHSPSDDKQPDYYEQPRTEMLSLLPEPCHRVLEIGCGSGVFGATVKALRGAEVWGLEPEPTAARVAQGRLDRVLDCPFPDDDLLPEKYFDCVVMNDVLEHMVHPERALARAKEVLVDGGVVVASIPNVRHFPTLWRLVVGGEWEYTERGILDRTHLRFFTRKSISALFVENGYRVDVLDGIDAYYQMTPADRKPWRYFRYFRRLPLPGIHDMSYLRFAVRASAA
jgi:SAM-dependent methyltransferase